MRQALQGQTPRAFPTGREVAGVSPKSTNAPVQEEGDNFQRFIDGLAGMLSEISKLPATPASGSDEELFKDNSD